MRLILSTTENTSKFHDENKHDDADLDETVAAHEVLALLLLLLLLLL